MFVQRDMADRAESEVGDPVSMCLLPLITPSSRKNRKQKCTGEVSGKSPRLPRDTSHLP